MTPDQQCALRSLQAAQHREAVHILTVVADTYGLTPAQVRKRARTALVVEARQVTMLLLQTRLIWPTARGTQPFSAERIAPLLRRHRTTIHHGLHAIAQRRDHDPCLRRLIAEIDRLLDDTYEKPAPQHRTASAA